jgi:hypothetical protein
MGGDREARASLCERVGEPEVGDVGLVAVWVGDVGTLDVGAFDEADREPGFQQLRPVVVAAAQVCLQRHLDRRSRAGEREHDLVRCVGTRAVFGADIQAAAGRKGVDYAVELPTTVIAGDVETEVREVDRDVGLRHPGDAMREFDVRVRGGFGVVRVASLLAEEVD